MRPLRDERRIYCVNGHARTKARGLGVAEEIPSTTLIGRTTRDLNAVSDRETFKASFKTFKSSGGVAKNKRCDDTGKARLRTLKMHERHAFYGHVLIYYVNLTMNARS